MCSQQNFAHIATIETDFKTKFGVPRQSGLVADTVGKIIFQPTYRNIQAVKGLQGFSHIWLLWEFSAHKHRAYTPTVRPPRLGGNERMGVFATRSPFRPNPIGISVVKLDRIDYTCANAPVIYILGADLIHGTPIYDIKPYIAYTDAVPHAMGGFTEQNEMNELEVNIPTHLSSILPTKKIETIRKMLALDPRPPYQNDEMRVYGLNFADFDIQFQVKNNILTVVNIIKVG